jgi:hypothetical protein
MSRIFFITLRTDAIGNEPVRTPLMQIQLIEPRADSWIKQSNLGAMQHDCLDLDFDAGHDDRFLGHRRVLPTPRTLHVLAVWHPK